MIFTCDCVTRENPSRPHMWPNIIIQDYHTLFCILYYFAHGKPPFGRMDGKPFIWRNFNSIYLWQRYMWTVRFKLPSEGSMIDIYWVPSSDYIDCFPNYDNTEKANNWINTESLHYWPFVEESHRWPMDSLPKTKFFAGHVMTSFRKYCAIWSDLYFGRLRTIISIFASSGTNIKRFFLKCHWLMFKATWHGKSNT